jgi:histidinol-phosphate phosphatase family protein
MNKININQAVIFCGGKGTRLGNLTTKNPKPMIVVNKKPFLEHLINQLKNNNIKNILLLTGYLHNKIKNYFNDGSKLGVKITYSQNPTDCETGLRLLKAKKFIKKKFLLLYCDNYSSLNINELNKINKNHLVTLSLVKKKNGNCKIEEDLVYYNKKNKINPYVEIGYSVINKKIFNYFENKNYSFSYYLKKLSKKNLINYFINQTDYLSIGDKKRLKITRKYFKNNNFVLVDRDGVLNVKSKESRYIETIDQLKINKDFIKNILKYKSKIKLICITNQAGIATKQVNVKNLIKINKKIIYEYKKLGIRIIDFFISKDHFLSNSFLRKPNPGLFIKASKKYKFILDRTFYIGDDKRDIEASYRAHSKCYFFNKEKLSFKEFSKYKLILIKNTINNTIQDQIESNL